MNNLDFMDRFVLVMSILSFLFIGGIIIDMCYCDPIAADNANKKCLWDGFDTYEEYKRVGVFSTEPVAVKCKYVENYRSVDLNINNGGGSIEN